MMHLIVLERDVVIARDIAETIREVFDDARVELVDTVEDACAALLSDEVRWNGIILHGRSDELSNPRLRVLLAMRAIPAIVTGPDTTVDLPAGWMSLQIPFTSTDMAQILRNALISERRPSC
jgi:hypothetical protein